MLKVHVRKLGNVAFLCLQGQIVRTETEALREAVRSQSTVQSDVSTIVLDLTQVSIIDAGGLGMILELREQVQGKGIDFKLMNVSRLVGWVLEISRLDSVFEITSALEFSPAVSRQRPASAMELASCA
ncbi:MAG: hypothetical protein JWM21_3108 [Acidobacteria bacterium]|nr:hypothetical protein [Acidobacteriota bacterium]